MEYKELNPTAERIIIAAKQLFMQRGYTAVSISDIIKAADITKPTLYYYFPDKAELFAQMGIYLLEEMHHDMDAQIDHKATTEQQLTALASVLLAHRDGNLSLMLHEMGEHLATAHQIRLSQAFETNMIAPIFGVMQRAVERGDVQGVVPELSYMFLSVISGFYDLVKQPELRPDWAGDTTMRLSITPEKVTKLFLYGVARTADM
ncbi:TetR/AcrR family transcriptional regulator [Candidatus Gracilibacteria bacterium]|nr:TetR/AcrR family transcriptional regulator [Candidatus Gracilibacteria bacterium]